MLILTFRGQQNKSPEKKWKPPKRPLSLPFCLKNSLERERCLELFHIQNLFSLVTAGAEGCGRLADLTDGLVQGRGQPSWLLVRPRVGPGPEIVWYGRRRRRRNTSQHEREPPQAPRRSIRPRQWVTKKIIKTFFCTCVKALPPSSHVPGSGNFNLMKQDNM